MIVFISIRQVADDYSLSRGHDKAVIDGFERFLTGGSATVNLS